MIRYHEALSQVLQLGSGSASGWESVSVSLAESFGAVLAEAVTSVESFPMFEASMVDGFALRAVDTKNAAGSESIVRFPVNKNFVAGTGDCGSVESGIAIGVATGAMLPRDADVVVKIENVEVLEKNSDGTIAAIGVRSPLISGDNIRYRGTDIRAKQVLLDPGTRIDFQHFPMLAALGIRQMQVRRRPRVGVICTGEEIVDWSQSEPAVPGKIRNATGAFLAVTLQGMGCDLVHYSCVGDSDADYRKAVEEALIAGCDVLLSTGAVSVGPKDFVKKAVSEMGAKIFFHRVAVRPGKPILCAQLGHENKQCLLFALPGNPMATAAGFRFFVTPYLRSLFGQKQEKTMRVALGNDVVKSEGMRTFLLGSVTQTADGLRVFSPAEQESFRVLPFARSNAWIVLPEVGEGAATGNLVEILPLFSDGFSREWLIS